MNGCFIETPYPLPEGTRIFVKIFKDPDFFSSAATVAYSQPNRGMGVQFRDVNRLLMATLQKWLLEAMKVPPA
jgi:hypothetical protein